MLEVRVQQQLLFPIGLYIIDVADPFADDEVPVAGFFDAIAPVGQGGDRREVFGCIRQQDCFPGQDIQAFFGVFSETGMSRWFYRCGHIHVLPP